MVRITQLICIAYGMWVCDKLIVHLLVLCIFLVAYLFRSDWAHELCNGLDVLLEANVLFAYLSVRRLMFSN